jgi:hypothetical protein
MGCWGRYLRIREAIPNHRRYIQCLENQYSQERWVGFWVRRRNSTHCKRDGVLLAASIKCRIHWDVPKFVLALRNPELGQAGVSVVRVDYGGTHFSNCTVAYTDRLEY